MVSFISFRILLCGLQTVSPDYLSQQNAACAGDSEAEGWCRSYALQFTKELAATASEPKVADDDGIGGKSDAPAHIISQCRQGKLYKVLEQKFVPDEHKPEIGLNILAENRNKETAGKLHNRGGCSSNGNTHNAPSLGAPKKTENKYGIQRDVRGKGKNIERHAHSNPADAAKHGQIDLRNAPAQVGDAHKTQIGGSQHNQLLIVGKTFIISSGISGATDANASEITMEKRSAIPSTTSMACMSPLPKYWAHSMVAPVPSP